MKQIKFQLDWRAAVVSWLFVLAAMILIAAGLYAAISTLQPAHVVWWIVSCGACGALGWKLRGSRDAPEPEPQDEPDVVEGESHPVAQIPPPDEFISVSDRMSVRQSQIEETATRVYLAMWPHTAPTRTNIKRVFPQLQSDGFISAVQAYLQQRGRCAGGGQGREYRWVIDSPTEVTDAAF